MPSEFELDYQKFICRFICIFVIGNFTPFNKTQKVKLNDLNILFIEGANNNTSLIIYLLLQILSNLF